MIYRKGGSGEPDEMPLANIHYTTYYETFKEMQALYSHGGLLCTKNILTSSERNA